MKVKELFNIGFQNNEGKYMTSKWIIKDDGWGDNAATIEYRQGKDITINAEHEVIFENFRLCVYSNGYCPSIPLKIKSKEDLIMFMQFF